MSNATDALDLAKEHLREMFEYQKNPDAAAMQLVTEDPFQALNTLVQLPVERAVALLGHTASFINLVEVEVLLAWMEGSVDRVDRGKPMMEGETQEILDGYRKILERVGALKNQKRFTLPYDD